MKKHALIFLVILFAHQIFPQDQLEKFSIQDYLAMTSISSPVFSPNGEWIVYAEGEKEKWDGPRNNNIWLVSAGGSKTLKLTNHEKSDWGPQWSPDGSQIAFLSSRSEKTQVYSINVSGGEAVQITDSKEGVNSFKWIDNKKVACVSDVPRDSTIIAAEEKAGGGYIAGTKSNKSALWVQSLEKISDKTKIIEGKYYISEMAAASDGKSFVLITSSDSDLYNLMTQGRVIVIDAAGNELFMFNEGNGFNSPEFSPDNRKISFVANTVGFSSRNSLFVADIKTGGIKDLTRNFDPTIEATQWLNDNIISYKTPRSVYTGIYQVSLDGEITSMLNPYWVVYSYSVNLETHTIAYIGTRSNEAPQLLFNKFGVDPENARILTSINSWLKNKKLASTRVIKYPSIDGFEIEARLSLPPKYDAKKKYPLMVFPHGGPDGIVTDRFHPFGQTFAQEGFIVFEPNFRGGIGYGSEFYASNRGKLGYIDYDDIMAGVNYLIKKGMIDTSKMVVGGWSYGGYMTNWIIGHTNIFKAAVTVASVSNTVSMYAQSDINHGEIARWEFMGVPVTDMENFTRSSPITYLKNCKTPTLILHGEADERVPVMQAWEIYRALEDLGVEVQMVLYPDAHHGISAPKQFADVITRWTEWYKQHLK